MIIIKSILGILSSIALLVAYDYDKEVGYTKKNKTAIIVGEILWVLLIIAIVISQIIK